MRVRELIWFVVAIAATAIAAQSIRAESGRPSRQTLAAMGLEGISVLSDNDAMSIRGFGFKGGNGGSSVAVFGNSFATINTPFGSAHSENGYAAEGSKFAVGANHSEAGVEITVSGGRTGAKSPGGNYGGKGGMKWGGKGGHGGMGGKPGGGGHGGKPTTVLRVRVFAGGSSFARAH
jgi:hypothetical protein